MSGFLALHQSKFWCWRDNGPHVSVLCVRILSLRVEQWCFIRTKFQQLPLSSFWVIHGLSIYLKHRSSPPTAPFVRKRTSIYHSTPFLPSAPPTYFLKITMPLIPLKSALTGLASLLSSLLSILSPPDPLMLTPQPPSVLSGEYLA